MREHRLHNSYARYKQVAETLKILSHRIYRISPKHFGYILPPKMREVFGYHVKSISDHAHKELLPQEVYDIFMRDFVNVNDTLNVTDAVYDESNEEVRAWVTIEYRGETVETQVVGNGRLDCVSNAIKKVTGIEYSLDSYVQHALEEHTSSKAAAYVSINVDGQSHWGTGVHSDIMKSSINALVSAVNRALAHK